MAMSEEKLKYFSEYKKEHLKKLQVDVRKEYYDRLQNICELDGISIPKFVKQAVDAALTARERKLGIDPNDNIRVYTDPQGNKRFRRVSKNDFEYNGPVFR